MTELIKLTDEITQLAGVGSYLATKFKRLGVHTIGDLLELLPSRLEDRSQLRQIAYLKVGEEVVIEGTIERVSSRRSKRGVLIIDVKVSDDTGKISALWFNQRFLLSQLKVGQKMLLFGNKKIAPSLGNPFFVKKIVPALEVAPIYPLTAGLSQGVIRRIIRTAKPLLNDISDIVPSELITDQNFPSRADAISDCHFSTSIQALELAHKLLALEELFLLCLEVRLAENARQKIPSIPISINQDLLKSVVAKFPFKLTDGQRRVAWQILLELTKTTPMNRILYGEVGSGKTAVAMLVAAAVATSGKRVVWLNPTLNLAHQQFESIRQILEPLGLNVTLSSSLAKNADYEAEVIIGTHAVLAGSAKLVNIGLVIVDEQHRFGVEQRSKILGSHPEAHLLMMSATPIPRSLAQTLFGHLEISYLLEKPHHQQPVKTIVFTPNKRSDIERQITGNLKRGEPGYVICPLIESQTDLVADLFTLERKAITSELVRLEKVFPSSKIAILHGRLKAVEKEKTLRDFREGKIDILLATTVVEVGIDNPSATWILIENAERFGLATLHQLRGRVGRGSKPSTCYLADTGLSEIVSQRIKALEETNDGLELAKLDLELRGPGEIVGMIQSGLPELKYATLGDSETLSKASSLAEIIAKKGVQHYPAIKTTLAKRHKNNELATA